MIAPSSILYQDPEATTFLIDIPVSIARAQSLVQHRSSPPSFSTTSPSVPEHGRNRILLSAPPLREPYPARTEPKTDAARANVLERTPLSERLFHSEILEPLVTKGLTRIRDVLESEFRWCLPRTEADPNAQEATCGVKLDDEAFIARKRKRTEQTGGERRETVDATFELANSDTAAPATPIDRRVSHDPPLILSPGVNSFSSMSEFCDLVVRNTSLQSATIQVFCPIMMTDSARCRHSQHHRANPLHSFYIPPLSSFLQCKIPMSHPGAHSDPIPGLPRHETFNLILLDPPWANRSVRRSGHYQTQTYRDWDLLTQRICQILSVHLVKDCSGVSAEGTDRKENGRAADAIAAIWITNSGKARKTAYEAMQVAGLAVCEEWVWVKTTTEGEPITPVGALWRKPYEILVIGKRAGCGPRETHSQSRARKAEDGVVRRVIAAVPDIHSRKPNLREVFEQVFFSDGPVDEAGMRYRALEVFARNLTAGWWAVGDEALKFNSEEWWVES
ncbi:MT-A70 family [Aspergillus homomorphus CBS 101889]|uniref:MT-A70-domain-containing protein n=1 Tax=Aspergillus homomorphus (strain CBS 101889) TaxID=1450537 RepID=A0A395HW56_ASPHC|nr:MT-A70-domain-containing protein [Aspergillus homomorphus CBS 101889]RAL12151.1 MT-A70-domain-containing protein [Aspergillus homomorphus CBS 101889]